VSLIGKSAPEWSAKAFHRGKEIQIESQNMTGSWYVIFWYPMDFTFVCSTELNRFEELSDDFEDDGIFLFGASTDSFYCHKSWFSDKSTFPKGISFPVIADTNHSVSRAFGVLKEEEGVAFRAAVIVDDRGILRSVSINDIEVGRNPKEILRIAQAFQSGGLCGAYSFCGSHNLFVARCGRSRASLGAVPRGYPLTWELGAGCD